MNKVKLDKGDQQLEMVGNNIIAFFKGIAAGTKRIIKEQDKMLLFVLVTLISGVIFYLRHSIAEYLVPNTGIHILKIVLLLSPAFPLIILYELGSKKKEDTEDEFQTKFATIKFCSKNGSYPVLKNKQEDNKKIIYTFYSNGISLYEWRSRKWELENVLDCNIENIENPRESKQVVLLTVVPTKMGFESKICWEDDFIDEKDFKLCIGKGLLNYVYIDLNTNAHALIAGTTGSGKSVILKCMIWQCIKKGAQLFMIDFKGGVEFGNKYEQFGEVVTERQQALELLRNLTREMNARLAKFRENGVLKIVEYNELHPDNPLCRIVIACDEVSEMLDKTGVSKSEQAIFNEIIKEMNSLARLGRAAGINMLLATQRPDANVIPGQIKNNLTLRICGRMVDEHASIMVVGNTAAHRLPDIKGRFVYTVGADIYEFQAFLFEDSLIKGNYQTGSMLIEQGYEETSCNAEFSDYDEEKDLLGYEPDWSEEEFKELGSF